MKTPQFDDGSPYAGLNFQDINGYMRSTVKGHAIADARGRIRLHRAVLYDAIGPGPHTCHWCGWDGLDWTADRQGPDYLIVDHLDGDGYHNRLANLVPVHKWCNDNRSVIERLGISWERIAQTAPGERWTLRTREGEPNENAHKLAAPEVAETTINPDLAGTGFGDVTGDATSEEGSGLQVPLEPAARSTGEHRWYVWDDYVDGEGLKKGDIRLAPPPEWLVVKYPQLRKVQWARFG